MTTDETAAGFRHEGEPAFGAEATDDETSAASQAGKENKDEKTQSDEGDKSTQTKDEDIPFHKHPRWTERESEWNTRFNDQEKRHQDDLKAIREEFGEKRQQNADATKIPSWFGGTKEQWDAYRADRDEELKLAGERAIAGLEKKTQSASEAEKKAVADATDFMKSEMEAIEGDKTLNPSGVKVDAEKLLKVVLENELIDTHGRWNYRAGFRILTGQTTVATATTVKKSNTTDRKEVAAATTDGGKGGDDKSKPSIATSETFKRDRPW